MNIEEIMVMAEGFFKIDETDLARESINTPKIYGELLRIRTNESMILRKFKYQFKALYQEKRDYYLGRAPAEVYKAKPFDLKVLKSEVDTYIEADEDFATLSIKIELQEEKLDYLDAALKQIANRGFAIKSAIDYQKMMNGGY